MAVCLELGNSDSSKADCMKEDILVHKSVEAFDSKRTMPF